MLITACQDQKHDAQKGVETIKSENAFDLPDSLSARRVSFGLDLKQTVAESTWQDFGKKGTEGKKNARRL